MKYDLVFEGGGAKGMVFVGAYEEFVKRNHTFGRLLGTSAGAITAVLLAAGYSPQEMSDALNEKENGKPVFAEFMGQPPPFTKEAVRNSTIRELLRNINLKFLPNYFEEKLDNYITRKLSENLKSRHFFSFVERGGWYSADRFITWLERKLDTGSWKNKPRKFSHMNLQQFYEKTQIHLSLIASNTTDGSLLVLNNHTAPECPVVWAVRMSMGIPLVWDEVLWKIKWGHYLKQDITGHAIVDGGLLSNFPLELFLSDAPHITRLMGPRQDNPVLGWLIDESLLVSTSHKKRGFLVDIHIDPKKLRILQRLSNLVDTATKAHDKMIIDEFSHLVVRLPAGGYGTTEFDMSDERREALVEAGRNAMHDYFENPPVRNPLPRSIVINKTDQVKNIVDRIAFRMLKIDDDDS